jgi:hypothetical protein
MYYIYKCFTSVPVLLPVSCFEPSATAFGLTKLLLLWRGIG